MSFIRYILPLLGLLLWSCDGAIYDDGGDCRTLVRFRYDMNMKWADAFPSEVEAVRLWVFDASGRLVAEHAESGEKLRSAGYCVPLDLPGGEYRFLAWCGTGAGTSFDIASAPKNVEELTARLQRDASGEVADEVLPLYHGEVTATVDLDSDDRTVTIPLTKDTNHLRVVLQQLSGSDLDPSLFEFTVTDDNGLLGHDNAVMADSPLTYRAWSVRSGTAGVDDPEGERAVTEVAATVADLTMSRLMTDHRPVLHIKRRSDGKEIVRLPVTDYALLVKANYGKEISDQEYLDRQDEYSMTFFLDEDLEWISVSILVNSWRVVIQETEIN